MSRDDSWGLHISTDRNECCSFDFCDTDFLRDMVEYFDLAEREDCQLSRSDVEVFVMENELDNDLLVNFGQELKMLTNFLANTLSETFYVFAYW